MGMKLFFRAVLLLTALALPAPARAIDLLLDVRVAEAVGSDRPDAAVKLLRSALAETTGPGETLAVLERLAQLLTTLGRPADAAPIWEQLARLREEQLGNTAPEAATAWQSAGEQWAAAKTPARAVAAWATALRIDKAGGLDEAASPAFAAARSLLAALPADERAKLEPRLRQAPAAGSGTSVSVKTVAPETDGAVASRAEADEGYSLVKIYYATNRLRTDANRPSDVYGSGRGPVDYGTAVISVPRLHRAGALEAPSIFSFDVVEDPQHHVILKSVDPSDKATVFTDMRRHLKETGSNEAFVFVHGFNVTFSDAARRTAQIAYDMNFDGLPILYSWPSQGNVLGYLADGAVVQLSGRLLEEFLEQVVADSGATRIHLVAHSMGNRALTEALEIFALRHAGQPPAFDQVLFTAPDLDAGLFARMVQTIRPAVNRMTLYTSRNDWALRVSKQLNGGAPRAGEGADGVVMPPVVDSIDMSVLGEDMLAHSYFADDASALTDILSLFWRDAPPNRRCGLAQSPLAPGWSFEPTLCDGSAMLAALRLLRGDRIGDLSDALSVIDSRFPKATTDQRTAIESALRRLFQP